MAARVHSAIRQGMTLPDIVDSAADARHPFKIIASCGPRGALSLGGEGDDRFWVNIRSENLGSESHQTFRSRQALRAALQGRLLNEAGCDQLFVGFFGEGAGSGWWFQVALTEGTVRSVRPPEPWK